MTNRVKLTQAQMTARTDWADDLRNGGYQQAQGTLCTFRDDDGRHHHPRFCCLGVAGVTHGLPLEAMTEFGSLLDGTPADVRGVAEIMGLTHEEESRFIAMNDDDGMTFDEIADEVMSTVDSGYTLDGPTQH